MAPADMSRAVEKIRIFCGNIERVITGKPDVIRLVVTGLLAGGHVLIEDVPGVGKSTLARALAKSLSCPFRRIQFTPDLLPSDITGIYVFNTGSNEFEFKPGPVFASIILADEINRTTPRTQSALLEAMNVGEVTVDGHTHELPRPFFVIATQNPLEYTGTYPLPEAQLDRFALCIRMEYPARESERAMIEDRTRTDPLDTLQAVLEASDVRDLAARVREVRVDDSVVEYLQDVIDATRTHQRLLLGASPRASLTLFRLCQSYALVNGRDYVMPDDIKELALPALAHRLVLRDQAPSERSLTAAAGVLEDILGSVQVPL
jgi:MoxR-like ATPase